MKISAIYNMTSFTILKLKKKRKRPKTNCLTFKYLKGIKYNQMSKMMNVSYGVLSLISINSCQDIIILLTLNLVHALNLVSRHYKVDIEYMKFYRVLK